LVIGFICNFLIKAVHARFHMQESDARGREAGAVPAGARA